MDSNQTSRRIISSESARAECNDRHVVIVGGKNGDDCPGGESDVEMLYDADDEEEDEEEDEEDEEDEDDTNNTITPNHAQIANPTPSPIPDDRSAIDVAARSITPIAGRFGSAVVSSNTIAATRSTNVLIQSHRSGVLTNWKTSLLRSSCGSVERPEVESFTDDEGGDGEEEMGDGSAE
jgi:hypothetical protein